MRPRRRPSAASAAESDFAGGSSHRPGLAPRSPPRARGPRGTSRSSRRPRGTRGASRPRGRGRRVVPSRRRSPPPSPRATVTRGAPSTTRRSSAAYSALSDWQRRPRTAGPREAFRTLNWIAVRSATRPIAPPSASISRTTWPFASPPTAGIAAHAADRRRIARHEERRGPETRGRERGLRARVPSPDDDDVPGAAHRGPLTGDTLPATRLLADAERREDPVEEILGGRLPRDRAERDEALAHPRRHELGVPAPRGQRGGLRGEGARPLRAPPCAARGRGAPLPPRRGRAARRSPRAARRGRRR